MLRRPAASQHPTADSRNRRRDATGRRFACVEQRPAHRRPRLRARRRRPRARAPATPRSSTAPARRPSRSSRSCGPCTSSTPTARCWPPGSSDEALDARSPRRCREADVDAVARAVTLGPLPEPRGTVAVVSRRHLRRAGRRRGGAHRRGCTAPAVDRIEDVGVAGLHRLLGVRDRLDRGRLPGRGRRHGGRAAVRRRRADRRTARRGADQRRVRRLLRRRSPRCWRCSTPARPASPWSTSTTGTAPGCSPPGWPAARATAMTHASGSTPPRAPAATCCSARWSAPASRSRCSQAAVDAVAPEPVALRVETVTPQRLRGHPRATSRSPTPRTTGPGATSGRCSPRRRSTRPCATSPLRVFERLAVAEAAVHGTTRSTCTSTRSARWTRSPTSSASAPGFVAPRRSPTSSVSPVAVGSRHGPRRARHPAGSAAGGGRAAARRPVVRRPPGARDASCARRPARRC